MQASIPERLLSAVGAVSATALLGYLLLAGMKVEPNIHVDQPVTLLAFQLPLPQRHPPKPRHIPPKTSPSRSKKLPRGAEGKAARPAILPTPTFPPMSFPALSAPTNGPRPAISSGASGLSGQGEGADGQGNGGGGGGGGGNGDGDVPPRQVKGRLKFSDLPQDLRDRGIGGSVSVRYEVGLDGQARDCSIIASSGSVELDQRTCELIQQRFRFTPARDRDGRPIRSTIEENHWWEITRDRDPSLGP